MILRSGDERVLVISDTQAPFQHPDTLDFLEALAREYKPTKIVAIGDTVDFHAFGKWAKDPEGYGPLDEYNHAIAWLKELYALFPHAVETASNHNARYLKRAYEAGLPRQLLKRYEEIMQFPPGWGAVENVTIDGVVYEHGTRFGGQNAARQAVTVNGQSTVFGHLHQSASIVYVANNRELLFGMNVGCMIDHGAYAFNYSRDAKYRPTLGTGLVLHGKPVFEPMIINADGEWTG